MPDTMTSGWHPDPYGVAFERLRDERGWTDRTRGATPATIATRVPRKVGGVVIGVVAGAAVLIVRRIRR